MPRIARSDAIALLTDDHRKVEDLFGKFESLRDDHYKQVLAKEICTELMIHYMVEEEVFYPSCKDNIEDEHALEEAYVEHDGAKVLISEIIEKPDAEFFDAKVMVLSQLVKHHVKEEEKRMEGLFVQAKEAGLDLQALGRRIMARQQSLRQQFASGQLPPPHTRSFTGHVLIQDKPVSKPYANAED